MADRDDFQLPEDPFDPSAWLDMTQDSPWVALMRDDPTLQFPRDHLYPFAGENERPGESLPESAPENPPAVS